MRWFKNLKTVAKLILAFALMAVLTGVVGYKGVAAAGDIDTMLEKLYDKELMGISAIQNANVIRLQIAYSVRYAMGVKASQKTGALCQRHQRLRRSRRSPGPD